MDTTLQSLARQAVSGDYLAILPLLDRLKDLADNRENMLMHVLAGLYAFAEGEGPDIHPLGRDEGFFARQAALLPGKLRRIFWPELAEGGLPGFLARMTDLAKQAADAEPDDGMIHDGPDAEPDDGMIHDGPYAGGAEAEAYPAGMEIPPGMTFMTRGGGPMSIDEQIAFTRESLARLEEIRSEQSPPP